MEGQPLAALESENARHSRPRAGGIRRGRDCIFADFYPTLRWILLSRPGYKGGVLLIGEAVHGPAPHLRSGGGMAIEDAAVLSVRARATTVFAPTWPKWPALTTRQLARLSPRISIQKRLAALQRATYPARNLDATIWSLPASRFDYQCRQSIVSLLADYTCCRV
jgi:hypothetical protein